MCWCVWSQRWERILRHLLSWGRPECCFLLVLEFCTFLPACPILSQAALCFQSLSLLCSETSETLVHCHFP